jgi:hypothetical protein
LPGSVYNAANKMPKKTQQQKAAVIVEPEPAAAEAEAEISLEDFAKLYSDLVLGIPPSVRRSINAKLVKLGLDATVEPTDEEHKVAIQKTLEHAQILYNRKRERARIAAAAKRASQKLVSPALAEVIVA